MSIEQARQRVRDQIFEELQPIIVRATTLAVLRGIPTEQAVAQAWAEAHPAPSKRIKHLSAYTDDTPDGYVGKVARGEI